MDYYVGAYASSPNVSGWNAELETRYYKELKALPNVKGLEHPFTGSLHGHDDDWFLKNIDPSWQFVFTCVPGIMGALAKNSKFGLASDDESGRQEALDFMQKACDAIGKLNTHLGREAVQAIQIQTAPNRTKSNGSINALKASLKTMLEWDWHGAQIVIEHCDTLVEGQVPAKGFLTIEDEINAVLWVNENTAHAMGIVVNWGRSVIETRNVNGAIKHIQLLKEHGLLSGLMFSGVSDQDTEYGQWKDTHMPPAPNARLKVGADKSLMTEEEMLKSIAACDNDELPILGIKLGMRPKTMSLDERVAHVRDCLGALNRYTK